LVSRASQERPLRLDDLDGITLRASDAFLAMGRFLLDFTERVQPESALVTICTDVQIEADRMSSDPAALSDWLKCVQDVLAAGEGDSPPA
jgi:hypothetical protein